MTSRSSVTDSRRSSDARTSTDGCPSKWGVVKNGRSGSWSSAALSASSGTQMTMTSSSRSPVSASTASGRGLRKNRNDLPPTWYATFRPSSQQVTCGIAAAISWTSCSRARLDRLVLVVTGTPSFDAAPDLILRINDPVRQSSPTPARDQPRDALDERTAMNRVAPSMAVLITALAALGACSTGAPAAPRATPAATPVTPRPQSPPRPQRPRRRRRPQRRPRPPPVPTGRPTSAPTSPVSSRPSRPSAHRPGYRRTSPATCSGSSSRTAFPPTAPSSTTRPRPSVPTCGLRSSCCPV